MHKLKLLQKSILQPLTIHPCSMNNAITVIDPLGNEVVLPHHLCALPLFNPDEQELYDKPSKVIEAPAMILQVNGTADETYYFRSIGWENLVLIGTRKVKGRWTAHLVVRNPSSQQLRDIYKNGNQVNLIDCKSFVTTFS